MVSPVYLIALPLGAAFLISLVDRIGRGLSLLLFYAALAGSTIISGMWLYSTVILEQGTTVFTAGFEPPLSIALRMGLSEAFFLFAGNIAALLASLVLFSRLRREKPAAMVLYLMVLLGAGGIILTRDLFNLFVFLEISSIATYAIIAMERSRKSLSAGFKYIIAGGIVSALFLIGTIYLYRIAGSLAIDDIIAAQPALMGLPGFTAAFLLFAALLIELKPFPANGWALDVYEAGESGVVSVIAVVNSGAILYATIKILPILPTTVLPTVAWAGILTFFFSNLIGLRQEKVKRLLGYSSSGQMGLLLAIAAFSEAYGFTTEFLYLTGGLLFLNHLFTKAGLFWLTSRQTSEKWSRWLGPKSSAGLLVFGILTAALAGLPPFPAFWAKWNIVTGLLFRAPLFTAFLLAGSLFEAIYLLRWYGRTLHNRRDTAGSSLESGTEGEARRGDLFPLSVALPTLLFAAATVMLGAYAGMQMGVRGIDPWFPLVAGGVLLLLLRLPSTLLGLISLIPIGVYGWFTVPELQGLRLVFAVLFLSGGFLLLLGSMYRRKSSPAFYPLAVTTILALGGLTVSTGFLQFFFAWELMTVASFYLILLGKKAEGPALSYFGFSLGGAFLVMAGLAAIAPSLPPSPTAELSDTAAALADSLSPTVGLLAFAMLAAGFLVKSGAAGVHVWVPGAYAEADDETTPLLSALLSKAGIFGLMLFTMILAGTLNIGAGTENLQEALFTLIRWTGALTALFGALMAVFQEDIKKLFAYSSMSQVGYIILTFGLMTHIGWVTALYIAFLHMLFKGLLFLVTAGVIHRTGTRLMYKMGGLIKRMPLSFIGALIGIISVSGVPPLAGFGAKWLLYNSLIEEGFVLLAAAAFFASTIAFLYLYRFIHVVFLGQLKAEHRGIREAPFSLALPQIIFLMAIMAVSTFPKLLVEPASKAASMLFSGTLAWEGATLTGGFGYWNSTAIMIVTMVVFVLILLWLLLVQRKPQGVKQFNIVFAAERPHSPETTHYGHNFFAPYARALGFLVKPFASRIWEGVAEIVFSIGGALRRIYNGNGQTYALHIMLFIAVLYFLMEAI
ncbi:MAG: proton-conducting transporter membrane subunit [Spirochaetaceae bacterium]